MEDKLNVLFIDSVNGFLLLLEIFSKIVKLVPSVLIFQFF